MTSDLSVKKPVMTITAVRSRHVVHREKLAFGSATASLFHGLWQAVCRDFRAAWQWVEEALGLGL